jgi:hypothetical protein
LVAGAPEVGSRKGVKLTFDEIQAEAITSGRSFGLYPALTIDGSDCRLSDQKGNFVRLGLNTGHLDMSISAFSSEILSPALRGLAEKSKES